MGFVERYFNITETDAVVKNPVFAGNAALLLGHHQEPAAKEFLNMVKIVPGFEFRIFAISLKPVPRFHRSKTNAFSFAVNVRFIQQSSATACFHMVVALTN